MSEPLRARDAYRLFRPITTRWDDNDAYGHVNNVRYYAYFDTAVNSWLVEQGLLDINGSATISLVVETGCRFYAPLAFPQPIETGLAIVKLGTSSVTYAIGVFGEGEDSAAAAGHFTHVHVDRQSRRPVPIGGRMRQALSTLLVNVAA